MRRYPDMTSMTCFFCLSNDFCPSFLIERGHLCLWRTELFIPNIFNSAFTCMVILFIVTIDVTWDICFTGHFRVPCHFYHFRSYQRWNCHFLFCKDFGLFNVQVSNMYKVLKNIKKIITEKLSSTSLIHFQQVNNRLNEDDWLIMG